MKTDQRAEMPSSAAVLRGVLLHAQPHALARPTRTGAAPALKIQQSATVEAVVDDSASEKSAQAEAYAAGHAEGRAEGHAAGRAAAEVEGREALQSAVEDACAKAILQGRLEGLAAGKDEAELEAGRAQVQAQERSEQAASERLERLDRLLRGVADDAQRQLLDAEDDLVALSHETVCRILGAQATQPESIRSMVGYLLAQHGQRAQLAVHVHPDDFAVLSQEYRAAADKPWRWVADEAVQLGGVVLRSPEGSLDARLETQLAALGSALLAVRRDRKGAALLEVPDTDSSSVIAP